MLSHDCQHLLCPLITKGNTFFDVLSLDILFGLKHDRLFWLFQTMEYTPKTNVPQQCFMYIPNDCAYLTNYDFISCHIPNTHTRICILPTVFRKPCLNRYLMHNEADLVTLFLSYKNEYLTLLKLFQMFAYVKKNPTNSDFHGSQSYRPNQDSLPSSHIILL